MENKEEAPPTLMEKIKTKTIETKDRTLVFLKDFWVELKKMSWIQLSVAFLLLIGGTYLSYRNLNDPEDPNRIKWMFFLIILGVILGTYVWIKFTSRFYEKIIYYIAIHKWTRKLVAGGSYCYFEYKDPEKQTGKKKLLEPVGITITSLIAFLGISATIIGVIRIFKEDLNTADPILWGVLALLTPVLASPLIPVAWSLDDSQMKTWASGNKTNWTVSSRYKRRFNGFISIGVVFTTLKDGVDSEKLSEQFKLLWGVLKTGILIMFISIGFFIIIYYAWFRNYLREFSDKAANLATNETVLVEKIAAREVEEETEPEADQATKHADSMSDKNMSELNPKNDESVGSEEMSTEDTEE